MLTPEELANINTENEAGEFNPFDYEDAELAEADIFSEEWEYENIDEEEQNEIQELYEENYTDAIEKLGYKWSDTETILSGPLDIELVND